jgi:polysaccharide deacetylase family sporulation protein PdaB
MLLAALGAVLWPTQARFVDLANPIRGGHNNTKVVALTFDDGPDPRNTWQVLDLLRRQGARATFFVLGEWVEKHPEIVKSISADGHQIGAHTYSHVSVARVEDQRLLSEITRTEQAILDACGTKPTCFRPPRGALSAGAMRLLSDRGYVVVLWDVDSRDWAGGSATMIACRVIADVHPGAIILMHDGGGPRPRTIKALDQILAELTERGYKFVTIDDMFRET